MSVKRSIQLECSVCHNINYLTNKNQKNNPNRLELNKYCSKCRKTTLHREIKKK